MKSLCCICLFSVFISTIALTQSNPVPLINQPLVPASKTPGAATFTLTVNGTGFVAASVVNWNASARTTNFVSSSQVTTTINASDIATARTGSVTVVNPGPGGGVSNVAFFQVVPAISALTLVRSSNVNGKFVESVVTADFNHDGKLDMAVGAGTGTGVGDVVSIFLGNGDGTFQTHVDYASGGYPTSIGAADFNHDGKLDLFTANGDGGFSILLGNGDGTFQTAVTTAFGSSLFALAIGDFNGDGKADVVTGDSGTGSNILVLLGKGNGTFQPPTAYTIPGYATGISTGDFNGDGKLDLAVTDFETPNVSILLGNGDGTFPTHVDYATGPNPYGIAAADFNGDGKLDLAIANSDFYDGLADNTISVLLGNGDGTFQAHIDYLTGKIPKTITTGDFNGDGKLDIATSDINNNSNDYLVSVLLGNGDGTFQTNVDYPDAGYPGILTTGDFNNDGMLDLVSANDACACVFLQTTITLTPTAMVFPTEALGTTSPSQTATLTNVGTTALAIYSFSLSGPNAVDFAALNTTCGTSLAAGASCTITDSFTPSGVGVRTATVGIADGAPGSPQTIALSGKGTVAVFSPTQVDFGQVPVNTSAMRTVTMTNIATQAMKILDIIIEESFNDFTQTNDCGSSLAGGASCTITVTFTPTRKVHRKARIRIRDNGGGSPHFVGLAGVGT